MNLRPNLRPVVALALIASLVACNKSAPQQQKAAGEILPGSASDAMLPLDTVKSQPPLAPHEDKAPGKADASEAADEAAVAPDGAAPAIEPDKAAAQ